jgi:hypothetical protein
VTVAHLGDRVAALVDGQLPPDAVERAHAHLAGCRPCREAVEAERLMKARLASLRGPEPGADLMQRLLAMGGPNGPLPPRAGHVPGTPRPPAVALPRATTVPPRPQVETPVLVNALVQPVAPTGAAVVDRPTRRRPVRQATRGGSTGPGRSRSRRRTRLAVAAVFGALSVVGVGITGLAVGASSGSPSEPTVVPPVDTFVVDHARTTSDLPFVDVPAGWQLTSAGQDGGAGR